MKRERYQKYLHPHCFVLALILLGLSLDFSVYAQEPAIPVISDTAKVSFIPVEKIPLASGEAAVKLNRLAESLVSEKKIADLKELNDHYMVTVDSALTRQKNFDFEEMNNRHLKNIHNYWTSLKVRIQQEKTTFSGMIKSLNDKQASLAEQRTLWKNTKTGTAADLGQAVNEIIDRTIRRIDSVDNLISGKTIALIHILNDVSLRGVEIDDRLDKINGIIHYRQFNILVKTDPALWKMDFTDKANWQLREQSKLFFETDILLMEYYFRRNEIIFLYYVIFLGLLIILFRYLNRIFNRGQIVLTSIYEEAVKKILSKPVSAGLILGLFSSALIFQNRPLIFTDIMVLLVSIPLIMIVSTIGTNIKYSYIYLFGIILILRFANYIFPPDALIHRLIILIIGVSEIVFFLGLMRYIQKQDIRQRFFRFFINFIIVMHIAFAIFGIAGDLFGSVLMADLAVNLVVTDAFIGFLLFVSTVILIGLIHFILDSKYMKKVNVIKNYNIGLKSRATVLIFFIGTLIWFLTVIREIGVDDVILRYLTETLTAKYKIGTGNFTIGSILLFFFVIWLSVIVSRIIRIILDEDVLERMPLKKGVPRMISVMTGYTLVVVGVFIAISLAGLSLSSLTIILGAFSVGIGFGLQNIFNNLVSGLILLFERPIQIGDVVEVGDLVGVVKSMGIRSSNLYTFDGAEVIVPNGHLISNEVINWTLSDKKRRIEIIPGVAYGSDVHKVHDLFQKILQEHEEILKFPAPQVYFHDLGESSLNFRLLFWTGNFDDWQRIRSEVIFKIYDTLKAEGIEIPFPQRDLHIKSGGGNVELKTKN